MRWLLILIWAVLPSIAHGAELVVDVVDSEGSFVVTASVYVFEPG